MNAIRDWIILVESTAVVAYHVTPARMVNKIMQQGLIPKIGRRSRKLEAVPGIYLFHSEEAAGDAVMNWLGDAFGETTRLALLAVEVPADATTISGADYETVVTSPIPASNIKLVTMDF